MGQVDIYFDEKYGEVTKIIDKGELEIYVHDNENGRIKNMFIKKKIPKRIEGKEYYDIFTPYGYGGPIIEEIKTSKELLLKDYKESFKEYCKENKIIAEFIRFHPLEKNYDDFRSIYDVKFLRNTVATELYKYSDPYEKEFSKSTRKTIRRSLKNNLTYEILTSPENLDTFIDVYYSTMDKHLANDFYYFSQEYFDELINRLRDNLLNINIYDEKGICISSGLYFTYGDYIQAHLSGTRPEYLYMSPAYILKYLTLVWGKDNGYKYIHYGGGTTNSEEDSLLKFKKKFTRDGIFDFYIGKKIYNKKIYSKLVELTMTNESEYFPKYREVLKNE